MCYFKILSKKNVTLWWIILINVMNLKTENRMNQYNNINQCVKSFFCKNDNKVNIFSILATLFNIKYEWFGSFNSCWF